MFNSATMLHRYRLPAVSLVPVRERIAGTLAAVESSPPKVIGTYFHEGFDFGSLALHDLMLANKYSDANTVPPSHLPSWWERVLSSIEAFHMASRICSETPISRLVTFNDTALQVSARLGALRNGVECRSIALATHRNNDQRRIAITNSVAHKAYPDHAADWDRWRDLALPTPIVREVSEDVVRHFTNRFGASHIYSTGMGVGPERLRRSLGLQDDRRTLVAYTSSLDEDNAARLYRLALGIEAPAIDERTFPDQVTWLKELSGFVSGSDAFQLVIRIHPREDANEREGATSQHLQRLRNELGTPPPHVTIVWPRDPTSSYDLARLADLVLVAWSSIGLELARAGLPVLATSVGATYTLPRGGAVAWAPDPAGYFELLEKLAYQPPDWEQIVLSYRWYAMRMLGTSVDVSDVVSSPATRRLPKWRTPSRRRQIVEAICGTHSASEANLAELQRVQSTDLLAAERRAIKGELGRLLTLVVCGTDPGRAVELNAVDGGADDRPPTVVPSGGRVSTGGGTTWLAQHDTWVRSASPMAERLATLSTS